MALYIVVPTLGWTWPSLLPLAIAAAAGYGYKKLTDTDQSAWLRGRLTTEMENRRRVSVPIDELVGDVIGEEVGRDERLLFERDDYRLIFRRDPRGKFFVDVLGPKTAAARDMREEAMAFARDLTQEFVYNRLVQEMETRGLNIVKEHVENESGDIVLDIRKWR
jgi:hypothetical protein